MGIRNRFRLDRSLIYRLMTCIPASGASSGTLREELSDLGDDKVRGVREWADDLELTHVTDGRVYCTALGNTALRLKTGTREIKLLEILYYQLAKCSDLEVLSELINGFLPGVRSRFEQCFDANEARQWAINHVSTRAQERYVRGEVNTALDALSADRGLGRLAMVVSIGEGRYRANSYLPDWRSAAYILYASWPENTSRVSIGDIVAGVNQLGRLFGMNESTLLSLLSKLEQERAIALEVIADLRQVGLNPAMRAADFLEMLCHDGA